MAKLYFRYGAMNSGKSSLLLQVAYNYEERDQSVMVIKPKADKKGNDYIVSRGMKSTRKVDYLPDKDDNIYEFVKNKLVTMAKNKKDLKKNWRFVDFISCILVDEAQFLERHHIDELAKIVNVFKIPVICYGLRSDFQTKAFPGSLRLFEIADEIEELITICRCGSKARFNARKIDGKFVKEGAQISIDGIDATYESMCRSCYMKYVQDENGDEIAKTVKKSVEEPINS